MIGDEGHLDRLDDPTPYDERVCRHGKRFAEHCRECELQGYCACLDCREEDA